MVINFRKVIGQNIRKLREAQGLSQRDLGKKIGKSNSTICDLEKGKRNVTLKTLEVIAEALGVKVCELFTFRLEEGDRPDIVRETGEKYAEIPDSCLELFSKSYYQGIRFSNSEDYYYLWLFINAIKRKG